MRSQNEIVLEHRLAQLETELYQLRAQVQRLESAPQAHATTPAGRYVKPQPHTTIHQTRHYEFEAKMPAVRRVLDFRSLNKTTNELVHIGSYSAAQIERACQKFSRLEHPSRKLWKGNRWLYSVARRLFAQAGAIQQHEGSRVWHWAMWPHLRRECCARIVAALSPKN